MRFIPRTTAVNLLMTSFHGKDRSRLHGEAKCFGAFVFDQATSSVYPIFAAHTILATGGTGQLYLHSTNSKCARGDGLALAYRAGCRLENLEYTQFHPTTFFRPGSPRFLISETVRGEGGVFLNQAGERFLGKYLPEYPIPELASRDKVAKAIHQELLSSDAACVYLDISHKPADWVRERFPFIHRSCLAHGVDITKGPIPGRSWGALPVWRCLDGSEGADFVTRPLGGWGGKLHGCSRGEPPGQHFASGRPRLGNPRWRNDRIGSVGERESSLSGNRRVAL